MIIDLFIGGAMIGLTVIFHAFSLDMIIRKAAWLEHTVFYGFGSFKKAFVLAVVVMAVFTALIVEIWLWALFYFGVGAFQDLETALYFSTSTFTTVGYGDVVLDKEWRLFSSVEACNGFLLFGWSTAFIFEVVSTVYRKEGKAIQG